MKAVLQPSHTTKFAPFQKSIGVYIVNTLGNTMQHIDNQQGDTWGYSPNIYQLSPKYSLIFKIKEGSITEPQTISSLSPFRHFAK